MLSNDLAVGREPPAAALLLAALAGKLLHTAIEPSLVEKGHEPARRVEKERVKGHRPPPLLDDDAFLAAQALEPGGDLAAVFDRGGEQQEVHPRGQVDHDLLPDHTALLVAEVVGLVEDHQVEGQIAPLVHGVVELVAEDLRRSHDDGRIGVLFCVAREDAHVHAFEEVAELHPLGIRQGLQGRGIPAALSLPEHLPDGLLGDPGLAGTCRGHDEAVRAPDGLKGLELEGVRPEGCFFGLADPGEHVVQSRLGLGFEPRGGLFPFCLPSTPGRERDAGATSVHGADGFLGGAC